MKAGKLNKYRNLTVWTGASVLVMMLFSCTPSEIIKKQYVTYNFKDQGFLDRDTLQVTGQSGYRKTEAGSEDLRRICTEDAYRNARKKALSAIMHVYFRIPPSSGSMQSEFDADYPFRFTETDYLRAEIDFGPVLQNGFIVMQDTASPDTCYILYRITEPDITGKIRESSVTFTPVNYKPKAGSR